MSEKLVSSLTVDAPELSCACEDKNNRKNEDEKLGNESTEVREFEVKKNLWENILQESEDRAAPYVAWLKEREEIETKNVNSPADYLDSKIFPILLPAMENMLREARNWDALEVQKCRFSGLDYLAEYLWNKNPKHPGRNTNWKEAFAIPQFKLSMRINPRPIFPKSWLWSNEEAALYIQRWVRGWLVRKREDVQELRQFWKAIENDDKSLDKNLPKESTNDRILDLCKRYKS